MFLPVKVCGEVLTSGLCLDMYVNTTYEPVMTSHWLINPLTAQECSEGFPVLQEPGCGTFPKHIWSSFPKQNKWINNNKLFLCNTLLSKNVHFSFSFSHFYSLPPCSYSCILSLCPPPSTQTRPSQITAINTRRIYSTAVSEPLYVYPLFIAQRP